MEYLIPLISMAVFAAAVGGVVGWLDQILSLEGEAKVRIKNNGHVMVFPLGANLMNTLTQNGYSLMAQCGGKGTCATCRIKAISGIESPTQAMLGPISAKLQKDGWILSCQTSVNQDIEIELMKALVTAWPETITTESANGAQAPAPAQTVPPKVAALRNLLPGFDCGACGHPTCLAYAEAIAAGKAGVDACLPGGQPVLNRLKLAAAN